MKTLFDDNLSPRLVAALAMEFPGSLHVHDVGLAMAQTRPYGNSPGRMNSPSRARTLVELSVLRGEPPKLVWSRRGNCSPHEIVALLKAHQRSIEVLARPDTARLCIIE